MALDVDVRTMVRADLAGCLEIEQRCFESPWSEKEFKRRLTNQYTVGLVAFSKSILFGFCMFELHQECLYLTTIAVEPLARRRGIATKLVATATSKLADLRRDVCMLDVRERNLPAQCLFRACGFKAKKVIPLFYADTEEASYRMHYERTKHGGQAAEL